MRHCVDAIYILVLDLAKSSATSVINPSSTTMLPTTTRSSSTNRPETRSATSHLRRVDRRADCPGFRPKLRGQHLDPRQVGRVNPSFELLEEGRQQQVERGRDAVLIIDEAQDLTDELLEQGAEHARGDTLSAGRASPSAPT